MHLWKLRSTRRIIERRRSAVFVKTFLVVAGISVASVAVMGTVAFRISRRQIIDRVSEAAHLTLRTRVAAIEERLARIDSIALQIAFSDDTFRLVSSGFEDVTGRLNARALIGRLGRFRSTNHWIYSLVLYDVRNGLVVSDAVTTTELFDDRQLLETAGQSQAKRAFPTRTVNDGNLLTLLYPYPFFGASTAMAVIIQLDYARFFDVSEQPLSSGAFRVYGPGEAMILPAPGTPPDTVGPTILDALRADTHYLVHETTSERWPWVYVYAQPISAVVGAAALARRLILGAAILVALLSALLAHAASRRLYRPLSDLVDNVERIATESLPHDTTEYDLIEAAVKDLADARHRMTEGYRIALSFFRRYSVAELLRNKTWDEDQFQTILDSLNVRFSRSATLVCLFESLNVDTPVLRDIVESFLARQTNELSAVTAIEGPRRVCALINLDATSPEPPPIVLRMCGELQARGVRATVSVSYPIRDLRQIPESYRETVHRLEIGAFFGIEGVVALPQHSHGTPIPELTGPSDRLMQAVKSLDRDAYVSVLDELSADIVGGETDAIARARFVFYHVGSRLQEVASQLGVQLSAIGSGPLDLYQKADGLASSEEMNTVLIAAMDELVLESDSLSRTRKSEAVESAVAYMERNYSRDLSIDEIAASVFLSSRYLNSLFNDIQGIPLHSALADIRIRNARRLLRGSPDMTVGEVARAVGYESQHSFMRMFKRNVGISPTMYRRNIARTGDE